MLSASTIKLLRLPFSIFLSPIYFFAISQVPTVDWTRAILIFIILHFMVYPASNGYNSYMDRDTGSIGGLEKPPSPSKQLYFTTIVLDLAAILLGFLITPLFGFLMPLYIGASKAYSYRGIRLKKYPVIGYLTVIVFQGAFTFWLVYYGSQQIPEFFVPWQGMLICALLIGGFYPLTQIYQHQQDFEDGVITISYKLGYNGTFIFCAVVYFFSWLFMAQFFITTNQGNEFLLVSIFFVPIVVYFIKWFVAVKKDNRAANFKNTMKMNWLAAICTNLAFIILLIANQFE
ncbi:UbiA family prenyltransferase [Terrimonas pollutisoli]|uniref:UbiA family prenyltransferase n=1 Tax=Terrimonas pollutisoli TaxID=3034147 RepID=UPI0023EB7476|nr:UbiA family prenyltransferase [Terrimonas sp. H1YJ31]